MRNFRMFPTKLLLLLSIISIRSSIFFNSFIPNRNKSTVSAVMCCRDTLTDQTLQRSVDVTKSFFNTVDSLLSGSKKQFLEQITQVFNEMRTALGENFGTVEQEREQIINTITAFFDRTEVLLDQAEAKALNRAHENTSEQAATILFVYVYCLLNTKLIPCRIQRFIDQKHLAF